MTATILFRPDPDRPEAKPRFDSYAPDEMEVDRDFFGFTPLYCPPEGTPVAADIIAITGLAGHAFGSWAHTEQRMWLRDYLPKFANNARILTYGYDTRLSKHSATIMSDLSNSFIDSLINMRHVTNCEQRPIIFIGHSLGGLLIKKVMTSARYQRNLDSSRLPVRAIVFLAAPHRGMDVQALRTLVGYPHTPSRQLIEELDPRSPTLNDMNERFMPIAQDIDILTCFETLMTKSVAFDESKQQWTRSGPDIMMVAPESAKQYWPRETVINAEADHSSIAKLKKDVILQSIGGAVLRALTSTAEISQAGSKGGMRDARNELNDQAEPHFSVNDTNHRSGHSPVPSFREHGSGQPRYSSHYQPPPFTQQGTQAGYRGYYQGPQGTPMHDYQRHPWGNAYGDYGLGQPHVPYASSEGRQVPTMSGEKEHQTRFSSYGSPDMQYPSTPPYPNVSPNIRAPSAATPATMPRQFYEPFNQDIPHGFTAADIMDGYPRVPDYSQVPGPSGPWRQAAQQPIHPIHLASMMQGLNLQPNSRYSPDMAAHFPVDVPPHNATSSPYIPPYVSSESQDHESESDGTPRFSAMGLGSPRQQ